MEENTGFENEEKKESGKKISFSGLKNIFTGKKKPAVRVSFAESYEHFQKSRFWIENL